MSNLLGIAGLSEDVRERFIRAAAPCLDGFDWLQFNQRNFVQTSLVWTAYSGAPGSVSSDSGGGAFFLLGRPDTGETAGDLMRRRKQTAALPLLPGSGGYYAVVSVEPSGVVALGADYLGLFPIYYYSNRKILIFSSLPGVFRHYPDFPRRLSAEGLAGIFLTMHLVGGRALWADVRRLSPGHTLLWKPGEEAKEVKNTLITVSDKYFADSFDKNLERIDAAIQRSVRKTMDRNSADVIMLSGGLDARLLAGYLNELKPGRVRALTLGAPSDLEMRCAAGVADHLKWSHQGVPVELDLFLDSARKKANWEQLANGFGNLSWPQAVGPIRFSGDRVTGGWFGDSVLRGAHARWGYDEKNGDYSFERFFGNLNRWGLSPGALRALFRPEFIKDSVDSVKETIKATYDSYTGLEFQRAWQFDLYHSERFHIGVFPWLFSNSAWPVIPYLDIELVELVAGMPPSTLWERRIQEELLCRRFTSLAALPMDRNAFDTRPLFGLGRVLRGAPGRRPPAWTMLSEFLKARLAVPARLAAHKLLGRERRYYYRVHDINNAGWIAVRREVERHRLKAYDFFQKDALDRLLPDPSSPIRLRDPIVDGSGIKLVLGFILWLSDNL